MYQLPRHIMNNTNRPLVKPKNSRVVSLLIV